MITLVETEDAPQRPLNTLPLNRQADDPDRRRTRLRLVERQEPLHPLLARRDPAFIRRAFPWLAAISDHYYRAEVLGTENMSDRASLVVCTHNGGLTFPDVLALQVAMMRRFGLETPCYGMAHEAAVRLPLLRSITPKLGAVYASPDNARIVLENDCPLLICPGGDVDNLKPFSQRHRVMFGARRGFIRTALRHQVPIIPVVSVGAHEVFFVLNDGRPLARRLGFDRGMRIKTVPLTFGFPNGLSLGGLGHLPLPAKVKVQVLPPMLLDDPPEAADDPEVVERHFVRVVAAMQGALDRLAAGRRWPVLG